MPHRPVLLIVEDDRALAELYRLALSLSNFAVHACADGLEALRYLEQHTPDVIVLDLNLPRLPGTIVYDELRAHAKTIRVPIVVVTGTYSVPKLLGATILRKPVSPDELTREVRRVLARRRQDWLYVASSRSVRIVRTEEDEQQFRLVLYGPGSTIEVSWDSNALSSFKRRIEIEHQLLSEGYRLLLSDRRSGRERRAMPRGGPDRRRQPEEPL